MKGDSADDDEKQTSASSRHVETLRRFKEEAGVSIK